MNIVFEREEHLCCLMKVYCGKRLVGWLVGHVKEATRLDI